jgi:predicted nucleic acid-binding protein
VGELSLSAKPTVYLETTIVGHLVGRIHPNEAVSRRQALTRKWWETAGSNYGLVTSELVLLECGEGDPAAARERLSVLSEVARLRSPAGSERLTDQLIAAHAVPASEQRDAVHISLAAANGVDYLLTWNFKHIANPAVRAKIESTCLRAGYRPPIICSPADLMEPYDGDSPAP